MALDVQYDQFLIRLDFPNLKMYLLSIIKTGTLITAGQATNDNLLVDPKSAGQQTYWFASGSQTANTNLTYSIANSTITVVGNVTANPNATIASVG